MKEGSFHLLPGVQFKPGKSVLSSALHVNEVFLLGFLLVGIQALDAWFTFVGVSLFGVEVEGNLVLRQVMTHWGPGEALAVTKGIVLLINISLLCMIDRKPWIKNGLIGVAGIYLCAAIFPWAYILSAALV